MKKTVAFFCLMFTLFNTCFAQPFTHADTLRGTNGPGRSWWDATKYDLHVKFNLEDSTISGFNIINFRVLKPGSVMQIDLQEPLIIDSIKIDMKHEKRSSSHTFLNKDVKKEGNAYFIDFTQIKFEKNF